MSIKSEEEWAERAAAFLKHKLREGEITYGELAKRLKKHGLKETEASITNKLARGTFPATFFLACIAALACWMFSVLPMRSKMSSERRLSATMGFRGAGMGANLREVAAGCYISRGLY